MSDPTYLYHQNNIFSSEAYKSIKDDTNRLRTLIYNFIKDQGLYGATCDEVEEGLDLITPDSKRTRYRVKDTRSD